MAPLNKTSMKKLLALGGIAVALTAVGWAYLMSPTITEVVNHEPEVVTEVVTVNMLEDRIEDAQEAKRAEIEEAAERAYNALYEEKMIEVADSVKEAYIAEIEATISSESDY